MNHPLKKSPPSSLTWQAGKSPCLIGDTSSNGCFSIVIRLFSGELLRKNPMFEQRIAEDFHHFSTPPPKKKCLNECAKIFKKLTSQKIESSPTTFHWHLCMYGIFTSMDHLNLFNDKKYVTVNLSQHTLSALILVFFWGL